MEKKGFTYRIAYGCWLNDSRTEPIVCEDWPSIIIDEETLSSLDKTMKFVKDAGYEYFDVFGLITNNRWTNDIVSTVDEERRALVRQAIDIIHKHGLKLIYGLGVYSWGFEDIVASNAAVRGTSHQVMCASSPESEKIMQQVVDFVATTFEIDGYHLEAADQGRCHCEKCAKYSDIEYYNRINMLVATYIRENYPDKTLLVNTSGFIRWGDVFSQEQLEALRPLGEVIDIFIDIGSHGLFVAEEDRPEFVKNFAAAYGTGNGFWIYPPQRWDRLRWFIPHFQQNIDHLGRLYRDGGRSCELYLSPLVNPGVEFTYLCNGLFLQDPERSLDSIVAEAVERLYAPQNREEGEAIANLFLEGEKLFFDLYNPVRNRTLDEKHADGVEDVFFWSLEDPDKAQPGELFLERLFGVGPGFPSYLVQHFDATGREKYRQGIEKLLGQTTKVIAKRTYCKRLSRLKQSLLMVLADIELVNRDLGLS